MCIVTGASSGIGEGLAMALALAGAKVYIAARREDRLASLKLALEKIAGPKVFWLKWVPLETLSI